MAGLNVSMVMADGGTNLDMGGQASGAVVYPRSFKSFRMFSILPMKKSEKLSTKSARLSCSGREVGFFLCSRLSTIPISFSDLLHTP